MTDRRACAGLAGRPQVPPCIGIGLRPPHISEVLARGPDVRWFEVHPENYMCNPAALRLLQQVRTHYPLSLHGVALSLGSVEPLDVHHLARLKALVDQLDPFLVSEHMAWCSVGSDYLNHLLPLPRTEEALAVMVSYVSQVQETLHRQVLVENPSGYLRYDYSTGGEATFLSELVRRTGCGLLCDVNNIYVSASNLGFDPSEYMRVLPMGTVAEIHLAGHSSTSVGDTRILIDDHASRVPVSVWKLFDEAVHRFGSVPSLAELQADFRRFIIGDRPPGPALTGVSGDGLDPAALLSIYRNNTVISLTEALATTFPVVVRLVDRRFFDFAADSFIKDSLPTSRCLSEYGRNFPAFLSAFTPAAGLAYLPDAAELEWLISRLRVAEPLPPISASALLEIEESDFEHIVFHIDPTIGYFYIPLSGR